MPEPGPAIAIMDRPLNHPDLTSSGGLLAWEMRGVSGPAGFREFAPRIVTDDAARAASAFAADLASHAQRTGVRPWLVLPEARSVLLDRPRSHLSLICWDQPAPAVLGSTTISTRVDANRCGEPTLIADLEGAAWTAVRYDPVVREMGRVRMLCSLSALRIEIPPTHGLPDDMRVPEADRIRDIFWSTINPMLDDPFVRHPDDDPTLDGWPLSWPRGSERLLADDIRTIAWSDPGLSDAYPFEVLLDASLRSGEPATVVSRGELGTGRIPLVERALARSQPIGWRLKPASNDLLPRRSDWRRVPIRIRVAVAAPSAHDRVAAHLEILTRFD